MMHDVDCFVACTKKACVVVDYSKKEANQRLISLGEEVSSIFRVHYKALLGVVDSTRNSIGYYYLSETVFPNDTMIKERNGLSTITFFKFDLSIGRFGINTYISSDEAISCRAGS